MHLAVSAVVSLHNLINLFTSPDIDKNRDFFLKNLYLRTLDFYHLQRVYEFCILFTCSRYGYKSTEIIIYKTAASWRFFFIF